MQLERSPATEQAIRQPKRGEKRVKRKGDRHQEKSDVREVNQDVLRKRESEWTRRLFGKSGMTKQKPRT